MLTGYKVQYKGKTHGQGEKRKQNIIFWQETHLVQTEHEKLKKLGFKNTLLLFQRKCKRSRNLNIKQNGFPAFFTNY